jgi:hypothetical protein
MGIITWTARKTFVFAFGAIFAIVGALVVGALFGQGLDVFVALGSDIQLMRLWSMLGGLVAVAVDLLR